MVATVGRGRLTRLTTRFHVTVDLRQLHEARGLRTVDPGERQITSRLKLSARRRELHYSLWSLLKQLDEGKAINHYILS